MEAREDVILRLLSTPEYSSGWIQSALDMISKYGWPEEECRKYNAEQLSTILAACQQGEANPTINFSIIFNPEMNQTQMQIIFTALSKGLTPEFLEPYLDPNIPYTVINNLLEPMIEKKIDLTEYLEWVSNDQAFEIKDGAMNGVDYTRYAYSDISGEKMGLIKHCLLLGMDFTYDRESGELTIR